MGKNAQRISVTAPFVLSAFRATEHSCVCALIMRFAKYKMCFLNPPLNGFDLTSSTGGKTAQVIKQCHMMGMVPLSRVLWR